MDSCRVMSPLFYLFYGLLLLSSISSRVYLANGAFPTCPIGCRCDLDQRFRCEGNNQLTELDLANFGMMNVPRFVGVFPSVTTIYLSFNLIEGIPTNSFSDDNFPSLINIYIDSNYISNIMPDAFDVDGLEILDLSNNFLTEFHFSAFSAVGDDFSFLNLQNNAIETVDLDGTTLDRENYPTLTIFLAGNQLSCTYELTPERLERTPFVPLCEGHFIGGDGATCITPSTMVTVDVNDYCSFVLQQLDGDSSLVPPPPNTQSPPPPPPATQPPPPATQSPPPDSRPPMGESNSNSQPNGNGSGSSSSLGVTVGVPVAVMVTILFILVTLVILTCLCVKYKMWERKQDEVALNQVEQRLIGNKLNAHGYNHFHPLASPTTPTPSAPSPRYIQRPVPRSPLPPTPSQIAFPPIDTLPGLKLYPITEKGEQQQQQQQQKAGDYPSSDDIYESIDVEEVYESSYIYHVESVPNRPLSMANAPLPHSPAQNHSEKIPSDHESDTNSVSMAVVEAEVFVNPVSQTSISEQDQEQPVVPRHTIVTESGAVNKSGSRKSRPDTIGIQLADNNNKADDDEPLYTPVLKTKSLSTPTEASNVIEDIENGENTESISSGSSTNSSASTADVEDGSSLPSSTDNIADSVDQTGSQIGSLPPSDFNKSSKMTSDAFEVMQNTEEESESEKRLSALKQAWGTSDKEDVAYLKVVL